MQTLNSLDLVNDESSAHKKARRRAVLPKLKSVHVCDFFYVTVCRHLCQVRKEVV
jgi:hypothetical protein